MERDYSRLRHAETRYRLLFQMASEAVLIVDAGDAARSIEANPAAAELLGETRAPRRRPRLPEGFDADSVAAPSDAAARGRARRRARRRRARALADGDARVRCLGSLFRQDRRSLFLVRLSPPDASAGAARAAEAQVAAAGGRRERARRLRRHRSARAGSSPPTAPSSTWRSSPPRSRRAASRSTAGSGGPGVDLERADRQPAPARHRCACSRPRCAASTARRPRSRSRRSRCRTASEPCFGFTIRDVGRRLAGDAARGRASCRARSSS